MKRFRLGLPSLCLLPSVLPALLLLALAAPPPASAQEAPLLTLDEAVHLAVQQNYELRVARNEARIAGNNYTLGNAGYLPSLGVTARQSQSALLGMGDNGRANTFGTGSSFEVGAGLNVTVFDGLARRATYERLGVLRAQGLLGAELQAERTLADVITVYYDIARQQQQLDVLDEAIVISEERLRIAELRRDLGSASELEVRRARVDLNTDRAARLRQEVALSNARADLNRLLGRERNPLFRVDDRIAQLRPLELDALETAALEANRALRLAEGARAAAALSRREVQAERLPRIDLQLGYAFNDLTSNLGLPATRPGGFNYGISATLDVFEGYNRSRRLQNAELLLENRRIEIEDVRTGLLTELENGYATYRTSLALIALEEENRALALQNVEVALERFRLGTITSVELREVQTSLTNIESRLVAARFEAKRTEVALLRLSGRLYDADAR